MSGRRGRWRSSFRARRWTGTSGCRTRYSTGSSPRRVWGRSSTRGFGIGIRRSGLADDDLVAVGVEGAGDAFAPGLGGGFLGDHRAGGAQVGDGGVAVVGVEPQGDALRAGGSGRGQADAQVGCAEVDSDVAGV